jgi:predicted NUDIX family phosphoesterase
MEPKRMILAAAAAGLPTAYAGTQFHQAGRSEALAAFHQAGLWIGPREVLEDDPSFRQIIPYVVLRHGERFVRYTRTPAGGEARLHGHMSIGLGGHIDVPDLVCAGESVDLEATIRLATERELREELGEVDVAEREWIGLLTDDETAVGRVHIGLVTLWTLRAAPAGLAEDAIGDVALCTLDELEAAADRLETWSALLLPYLKQRAEARAAA